MPTGFTPEHAVCAGARSAAGVPPGDACARSATPSRTRRANAAALGAGTLVFVGRFDLAEFAVVLEPDEPLRTARRAFYAGMAALTDALLAHAPPEKPIGFAWPDAITVDQRPGRRRAARLGGRTGGRAAGLACVRRHDPHRLDGRGRAGAAPAVHGDRGRGLRRGRRGRAGRQLRAPSDGADRCLAGVRLRRRSPRPIWRGWRRSNPCAATSTTTAICWCGAWAKRMSSGARWSRRWPRRHGSTRPRGGRSETAPHLAAMANRDSDRIDRGS